MREQLKNLIEQIIPVCSSWIVREDDGLEYFIDPIDKKEISAHYGATHAAAAFILWGKYRGNDVLYEKGINLLRSILKRWEINTGLPAFHFDFNNFALTIIEPFVDNQTVSLIKNTVCKTNDSNHNTINWLPMRWAVNLKRAAWSKDDKFQNIINTCKNTISKAINADGGIEDRLPNGKSFNLQYDLATVAILQYLCIHGEHIDISKELGFLLNSVAPDGDINYQGRGTNQIFAWGLWIYLLASSGQMTELKCALDYLKPRLLIMLSHNNMMLNEWEGEDKYLWWDYHYTSVYTAHCLLWLIMAYLDIDKNRIIPVFPASYESGLHIHRSENFFVSWFNGRKEYLAEQGPTIAAIWTKSQGMICKGSFGPWQGFFGNKYIYENVILNNYCGLLEVKHNFDVTKKKYLHKLLPELTTKTSCTFSPVFCPISVMENNNNLVIVWAYQGKSELIFNLPSISLSCDIELWTDDKIIPVFCNSIFKNQYGWVHLFQSRAFKAHHIKLVIK